MSSDYFLKVAGITGGSVDQQHQGEFEVLGYEFDLASLMSHAGGGGTGKPIFSPLFVDLAATPGLAELLHKAATGQHIPEVIFTARKEGGDPFEYETIKLTDVVVLGYEEQAGFAPRVALGYGRIEVELKEQSDNGGPPPAPVKFAFDVEDSFAPVAPAALEPVVRTVAEGQPSGFDYYLKVEGILGSSQDADHEDEFDIVGYEFDLTAAMSHAGGAGAGKTTLSPLVVDFEFSPGLVALFQKAATGAHIPELTFTVEKAGGDGAAKTYQTIKLEHVTVLGYEEKAGFATRVAFGYEEIEVTIKEQKPGGGGIEDHVFAFNVAASGALAPVGELAPEVKLALSADYFLKVDGIAGGSLDQQHTGEFEVLGYEFDLASLMSHAGGGGTGKTTFSPFILDLAAAPGLAELLQKAAAGQHIPEVVFTARKQGGLSDYETIKLKDVVVLGYEEQAGFAPRVALGYGRIEVELKEQPDDGSTPSAPVKFAFDVAAGGALAPLAPGALEPAVRTVAEGQPSGLDYFLKVDGIAGSSNNENHENEFDIVGYEFDLAATMSHAGGGGTGKTTLSPLVVDFEFSSGLATLLQKVANGAHIPELTFTIEKAGTNGAATIYQTIKLENVTVLGYEEKAGFATRVAFGYQEIEVTIKEQQAGGSGVQDHVFAFNVAASGALAPVGPLEPEVKLEVPADYFLKIAGIMGGSLDQQHKGEFEVLGYEFDLASIMSQAGGGGTGKPTFSPLFVDLAATPGLADLLQKAATGQRIPEVTFTARKEGGEPFEYETIKLKDVVVLGYEEQSGFAPRVALGYGRIEVELKEQSDNGGPAPAPVKFAFDVDAGGALGPVAPGALEAVVRTTEPDGSTGFDYFLEVDGIAGSSDDAEHKDEFEIVGYEFDLTATMSHAGGAGAGKTTLSPLVVDFEFSPGLAALLKKAATGAHIPEMTFTVEKAGGDGPAKVYQTIELRNVTILSYDEQAGENTAFVTRVAFAYDEIEVTVKEQQPDGTSGEDHVFIWNTAENHEPVITTPPTETPAEVTDGAFTAAGQVSFIDPDGDEATASAALFEILPVGTTLPADALALLRPLLEAAFEINPATGAWQFNLPQDAAKLLAANEVMEIVYRVTVSDSAPGIAAMTAAEAAAATQDIVISIQGVNDAPVIDSIATQQVNELANTAGSSALDTVAIQATFNDADLNDTGHTGTVVSVMASGATAGLALSNPALLALLAPGAVMKQAGTSQGTAKYVFSAPDKTFDYLKAGQKLTLTYTIAVDDHDGGVSTQTAVVEINGANDAPVFASPVLFTVQENKTAVGAVVATDIEGESLTFKLVGGDDQALFAIDPATGALRFLASPDFETREDLNHDGIYKVVVSATDASGGVSTQAISIKVADVSEPGKLVNGGNGNDSLNGGTGGDIVLAGNGNDTVNANDGNDIVFGGNGDDLLRGGRGDDGIYGDNGDDTLDGGLGNDLLFGGNGKDILKGGAGNDMLFGDNGNDRFVFGPNSGDDVVFDFRRGDIIEFQGDVFDSFAEVRAASRQVLGSTVIDTGDDTIVLIGVELRDLRASDFLFT